MKPVIYSSGRQLKHLTSSYDCVEGPSLNSGFVDSFSLNSRSVLCGYQVCVKFTPVASCSLAGLCCSLSRAVPCT